VHNGPHRLLFHVDHQVRLHGRLVRVIDAGEALDLASARLLVDAALVCLLGILERRRHVDEVEVAVLLHQLPRVLSRRLKGGDGRRNDGRAGPRQLRRNKGDAGNVLVAVLLAEAQLGRELVADRLAEEERHGPSALLVQGDLQGPRDLILAAVLVSRQEDGEALLRPRRVRLPQHLDNLGVREPLGDLAAAAETRAELCSRDVERADALGDLVDGCVLVAVGEICHHLEGDDNDAELVLVLLHLVLGVVGAVKVDALAVLAGAGVVTPDDEVGGAVVLADDGVPDSLARASHSHGQGEQAEDGHAIGVSREERLVHTHAGEVVDVAGLGETHDGVDEDVGLVGPGGANGQLPVSAVHGVSGLEGDDLGPAKLVKVKPKLGGCVYGRSAPHSSGERFPLDPRRHLHRRSTKS